MMLWIVRGALLVLLAFANLNLIWSPDVLPNTLFAWTLVRSGNLDYDEFATVSPTDERPDRIDRNAYFFRDCGDLPPNVQVFTTSPRSAGGAPPPTPGGRACSLLCPRARGARLLDLPARRRDPRASGARPGGASRGVAVRRHDAVAARPPRGVAARGDRRPPALVGVPSVRLGALVGGARAPVLPRDERADRRITGALAARRRPSRDRAGTLARPRRAAVDAKACVPRWTRPRVRDGRPADDRARPRGRAVAPDIHSRGRRVWPRGEPPASLS